MLNCVFIEGLPGSGKTTFSQRLEKTLQQDGYRVKRYSEGDLHPLDLAWIAIIDQKNYQSLLEKYADLAEQIKKQTLKDKDRYYVAYTNVPLSNHHQDFLADFAAFEIYRKRDIKAFKQAHIARWKQFAKTRDDNTFYIFECVFLQNHINEILLKHTLDLDEITTYFNDLLATLGSMKPMLFYIEQADVFERIAFISEQRKTNNKVLYKDWIDYVIEYISAQPMAKTNNYTDFDGVMRYFNQRQTLEKQLIPRLSIPAETLTLSQDYDAVFNDMVTRLKSQVIR